MRPYKNLEGGSGVSRYEIGDDYVVVLFVKKAKPYKYSYQSAGKEHVENMKRLAKAGRGLSTYISRYVHDLYDQ